MIALLHNPAVIDDADPNGSSDVIRTLDISDPTNIQELGNIGIVSARDLALDGQDLYIASSNGVLPVDVSDPTNPVSVANFVTTIEEPQKLHLDGSTLYVVGTNTLQLLDISDPFEITSLGSFTAPSLLEAAPEEITYRYAVRLLVIQGLGQAFEFFQGVR